MRNKKTTILIILILTICINQMNATTLSIPERHAPAGSIIKIPVKISDGVSLAGAEIVFQYDATLLEFQEANLSAYTSGFVMTYKENNSQVAVSIAGATGLIEDSGILFYLTFRVKRSAQIGTATEITLTKYNLYDETGATITAEAEHGVFKVSDIVVFPNPFTPNEDGFNDVATFVVPDSLLGNISVKLFNISGGKVAEISEVNNSTLEWNGQDEDGNKLRPGPYIYLLQSDSKTLSKGTITIMR